MATEVVEALSKRFLFTWLIAFDYENVVFDESSCDNTIITRNEVEDQESVF